VNALDGARERQRVRIFSTARFGSREQNGGAHSFSAGENGIAHGLVNRGGLGFFTWQKFVERAIDGFGARGEELVQVKCIFCGHEVLFLENGQGGRKPESRLFS
jgi:hypothetical protein